MHPSLYAVTHPGIHSWLNVPEHNYHDRPATHPFCPSHHLGVWSRWLIFALTMQVSLGHSTTEPGIFPGQLSPPWISQTPLCNFEAHMLVWDFKSHRPTQMNRDYSQKSLSRLR